MRAGKAQAHSEAEWGEMGRVVGERRQGRRPPQARRRRASHGGARARRRGGGRGGHCLGTLIFSPMIRVLKFLLGFMASRSAVVMPYFAAMPDGVSPDLTT